MFPIIQKFITTPDKIRIGYQIFGRGKKTIILCNGLGGNYFTWKPLYEEFADEYRFLTWDYRGLYTSGVPADPALLSIPHQAQDLQRIMKAEKITKGIIGGWSMGVQVALEFYRLYPKKVGALFLLNGTPGAPFKTALNLPLGEVILPRLNRLAQYVMPSIQTRMKPLALQAIRWKGFVDMAARIGLVHPNLNREIFEEVAQGIINSDLEIYHQLFAHMGEHDARDILSTIEVPTLIIAGEKDVLTPPRASQYMADKIDNSQLFLVPQGTHYSLIEFPDLITLRLGQFLSEH